MEIKELKELIDKWLITLNAEEHYCDGDISSDRGMAKYYLRDSGGGFISLIDFIKKKLSE